MRNQKKILKLFSRAEKLFQNDPGHFRLRHTIKTVLAIFIALAIIYFFKFSSFSFIFAGFGAGLLMQSVSGGKRSDQQAAYIIMSLVSILIVGIASVLTPHTFLSDIFLVVLTFALIYCRRYGPYFTMASIGLWIFGFVGLVMPGGWLLSLQYIGAVAIGAFVGYIIHFYFWPPKKVDRIFKNLEKSFSVSHLILKFLQEEIRNPDNKEQTVKHHDALIKRLEYLLFVNQYLVTSMFTITAQLSSALKKIVIRQYVLHQMLSVMITAVLDLFKKKHHFSQPIEDSIEDLLEMFIRLVEFAVMKSPDKEELFDLFAESQDKLDALQKLLQKEKFCEKPQEPQILDFKLAASQVFEILVLFQRDKGIVV